MKKKFVYIFLTFLRMINMYYPMVIGMFLLIILSLIHSNITNIPYMKTISWIIPILSALKVLEDKIYLMAKLLGEDK